MMKVIGIDFIDYQLRYHGVTIIMGQILFFATHIACCWKLLDHDGE